MTTEFSVEQPPAERPSDYRFTVDTGLIESQGRQAAALLASRLCPGARSKLAMPVHSADFGDLRKLIRDECAKDPAYVGAQLPVMETAFRMLLTSPEGVLTLRELHQGMANLWHDAPWPRHIAADALLRVLRSAAYYGVRETT